MFEWVRLSARMYPTCVLLTRFDGTNTRVSEGESETTSSSAVWFERSGQSVIVDGNENVLVGCPISSGTWDYCMSTSIQRGDPSSEARGDEGGLMVDGQ